MATLTLRDVPDDLHNWLKRQAETHHRSMNKEVLALLETVRSREPTSRQRMTYEEIMAISKECAALPVLDTRSEDEILGYDENGIPR